MRNPKNPKKVAMASKKTRCPVLDLLLHFIVQ
jgi:hypothetical protein